MECTFYLAVLLKKLLKQKNMYTHVEFISYVFSDFCFVKECLIFKLLFLGFWLIIKKVSKIQKIQKNFTIPHPFCHFL